MNVLFISIDSLRRDCLSAYDGSIGIDIETPNIDRFARKAAVFDSHYAGSLPCMPARREWLTGTQEFLWRPWGPIEPFDESLPALARDDGVLSQLITDHYHYIQHGSSGYYEDFNGFEFIRGQEYDAWKTSPRDPRKFDENLFSQMVLSQDLSNDDANSNTEKDISEDDANSNTEKDISEDDANSNTEKDISEIFEFPEDPFTLNHLNRSQAVRNALDLSAEEDFFPPRLFKKASTWLQNNIDWSDWFLYIDSYDVHEPFLCPEPYASMYTDEDPRDPELTFWPYYGRTDEGQSALSERQVEFVRSQYAGKLTMLDTWFERLLNTLDEKSLWDETMVIFTSDHGYFLGEKNWMGKMDPPVYDILAKTPLFVWHPNSERMGERISALTSAVDLYSTILDGLDIDVENTRHSQSLMPLLTDNTKTHRDWALYGVWGASVNITDGEYTYMRPAESHIPTNLYSTMMMNQWSWTTPQTPKLEAESGKYLPYTKSPVWRYQGETFVMHDEPYLFNVDQDPDQSTNLVKTEPEHENRMKTLLNEALDEMKAPENQYNRLSLN